MSANWTDTELALLEALRPVCSTREILKVLKELGCDRSLEAIQKKARLMDIHFKDFGEPVCMGLGETEQKAIAKVLADRDSYLTSLAPPPLVSPSEKGKITTLQREASKQLYNSLQEVRAVVPRIGSISTIKATGDKLSLVLAFSDHHIGKTITDLEGQELYNSSIGCQRILNTPNLVVQSAGAYLSQVDELIILLIGDHIEGEDVLPGQNVTLDEHVASQVMTVSKALWQTIRDFKEIFPIVRIVSVRGNHGRGSNSSPEANFDHMVYQHLELLVDLAALPNLSIKNRYGEFNTFEVKGWRGIIRHKAPAQSETASGIARFAGWHMIHDYDICCFGHWHHWGAYSFNNVKIIRNGSLCGGDDFAEMWGATDDPTQVLFVVSPESACLSVVPIPYI